MKAKRELKVLGDAGPDPELDARLEAMEELAEQDLIAGRVGFKWAGDKRVRPSRTRSLGAIAVAVLAVAGVVWKALSRPLLRRTSAGPVVTKGGLGTMAFQTSLFVTSLALTVSAACRVTPEPYGVLIHAPILYDDGNRF